MDLVSDGVAGLSVSSRSERGWVIAALSGDLDIACAPALREQLLGLLRPAASRLVIDLSRVSYADASGLTVLVGTRRRAGLLGGFLRLAAPTPPVAKVLRITGLHRRLDIFPTVQAAITSAGRGQRPPDDTADAGTGIGAGTVHTGPARGHTGRTRHAADAAELRLATAAVLMHADAWRDADPHRRFTAALHALACAYAGTSQAALTRAAHSLLSVLTRQPLTYSPAVAATASGLRRLLDPIAGPPSPEANPRTHHRRERLVPIGQRHVTMNGLRRRPAKCNPRVSSEPGGREATKADVPGLLHKSDADAVKLDLSGASDMRRAQERTRGDIRRRPHRVLVQPVVADGTEVIIGVIRQPVSGPVVVFGPGGVATEVLSDHSARLAPLTGAGADGLIRLVRAAPLLPGHRVAPAAGLTALSDTLLRASRLADDLSSRCGPPKRQLP